MEYDYWLKEIQRQLDQQIIRVPPLNLKRAKSLNMLDISPEMQSQTPLISLADLTSLSDHYLERPRRAQMALADILYEKVASEQIPSLTLSQTTRYA